MSDEGIDEAIRLIGEALVEFTKLSEGQTNMIEEMNDKILKLEKEVERLRADSHTHYKGHQSPLDVQMSQVNPPTGLGKR